MREAYITNKFGNEVRIVSRCADRVRVQFVFTGDFAVKKPTDLCGWNADGTKNQNVVTSAIAALTEAEQ